MEEWRSVTGWEGFYEVSDMGRVRSVDRVVMRKGRPVRLRGRVLRPSGVGWRPMTVAFSCDGQLSTQAVHRLVLETFGPPCPPGMEALHGPRGGKCNELSNLSWGTHAENCGPDRDRDDTQPRGERQGHSILTEESIPLIRSDPRSDTEIASDYGVHRRTISDVRRRETWKHVP